MSKLTTWIMDEFDRYLYDDSFEYLVGDSQGADTLFQQVLFDRKIERVLRVFCCVADGISLAYARTKSRSFTLPIAPTSKYTKLIPSETHILPLSYLL